MYIPTYIAQVTSRFYLSEHSCSSSKKKLKNETDGFFLFDVHKGKKLSVCERKECKEARGVNG